MEGAEMVVVRTRKCLVCGLSGNVVVPDAEYRAWQDGKLIQDAIPSLPKELREQLISGTHPECWERMFSSKEDGCGEA